MEKTLAFALCAAVGAAASAHPFGDKWPAPKATPGPITGVDSAPELSEDFEGYPLGAGVSTMGGWELWPGGGDALVTDAQAASGTQSGDWAVPFIDVVHQFSGLSSGQLTFSAMTYMDSAAVDIVYYMIALNQYDGGGAATNWSMQVKFDSFLGELEAQFRGDFTSIIFDQWVEFRAEIDLDADLYDLYYDGVLWAEDLVWTEAVSGGGLLQFAAIDLYTDAAGSAGFWLDDVVIESAGGGCYADCDGSGTLDFFDFLCFQNAFATGDPYADCDGTGTLDFFDFLCFQNEFALGCP
ncbi:MAG: hypothetical protein ACF8R7_18825 [Phycisphaerales bacterium JB039]